MGTTPNQIEILQCIMFINSTLIKSFNLHVIKLYERLNITATVFYSVKYIHKLMQGIIYKTNKIMNFD